MSPRIAVVGDFDPRNPTHEYTSASLEHVGLAFDWIGTDTVGGDAASRLAGYQGIWCGPASPYRSMDGALAAIRHARERGVPFVGT